MKQCSDLPFISRTGRAVMLRQLAESDQAGLGVFLCQLSAQTRYLRYLAPLPPFAGLATKREIERLLNPLAGKQVLLAVDTVTDHILGIAELARQPECYRHAEIALTVADPYQREGIGLALSRQMAHLAVEQGLEQIAATILPENIAVRRLLASLGLHYQWHGSTLLMSRLAI